MKAARPRQVDAVEIPDGATYSVHRVAGVDPTSLPANSDLKMVDGDVARYAVEGCELDVALQFAPNRCDVYVQADKAGTLIGYAFVTGGPKGSRFRTITTLNDDREPGGSACALHGTIYDREANYQTPVMDPGRDFNGRQSYTVWKNDAGSDLVSEVDPNADPSRNEGAFGAWYVSRQGDKLRIEQERWNYCYKDASVTIDDVFYRVVTLQKVASRR